MKTEVYESIGVEWPILVPETVDEYNLLAKRPGNPCLEDATDHTVYHDTLGNVRYEFAEALGKELKIDRLKKDTGEKDTEGKPILKPENDGAYINRMLATSGKKASDFPEIKKMVLEKVKFDPSVSSRTGGKQVPKSAVNAANELLAMNGREINGKVVDANAIAVALEGLNPEATKHEKDANGLVTSESLARLINANEARKRAAVKLSTQYADPANVV